MKRFSILLATVCVALTGFAQGSLVFPDRLITSLLIQTDDEAVRDLALRKRIPNLAIESHPYFRGSETEVGVEFFPGIRVLPGFTDELFQVFPVITPVQPGFRTFPLLAVEPEAIFTPVPSPAFRFNDLFNQRTTPENMTFNPTGPGGRRLHAHSETGDSLAGGFSAPAVTTVPEPGTCALLGLAGLAAWFIRCRKR